MNEFLWQLLKLPRMIAGVGMDTEYDHGVKDFTDLME